MTSPTTERCLTACVEASNTDTASHKNPVSASDDTEWDDLLDALRSYHVAVAAIGERVKAGEPVPPFFAPPSITDDRRAVGDWR